MSLQRHMACVLNMLFYVLFIQSLVLVFGADLFVAVLIRAAMCRL